ncbi:MAG: septal ring lytic transglycosylase RlpA family protein [Gammaproteobacteria bacterium]
MLPGRGSAPRPVDLGSIEEPAPRSEPLSRYGNPESYKIDGRVYYPLKSAKGFVERGIASWYGPDFHGKRTSSGEGYDMYRMTAAHRILPLPTFVEVRNLQNGRRAIVRVNDRGPFKDNRVIDLSYVAALKLGIVGPGTGLVEVRAIDAARPMLETVEPGSVPPPPGGAPGPAPSTEPGAMPVQFWLQVGAFRDLANAERALGRVRRVVNGSVAIASADVQGVRVHRVRVGPLTDIDESDRIVAALERDGWQGITVVTN